MKHRKAVILNGHVENLPPVREERPQSNWDALNGRSTLAQEKIGNSGQHEQAGTWMVGLCGRRIDFNNMRVVHTLKYDLPLR